MGLTVTSARELELRARGSRPLVACQCQRDRAPPRKRDENSSLTMLASVTDKMQERPNTLLKPNSSDPPGRGDPLRSSASWRIR